MNSNRVGNINISSKNNNNSSRSNGKRSSSSGKTNKTINFSKTERKGIKSIKYLLHLQNNNIVYISHYCSTVLTLLHHVNYSHASIYVSECTYIVI